MNTQRTYRQRSSPPLAARRNGPYLRGPEGDSQAVGFLYRSVLVKAICTTTRTLLNLCGSIPLLTIFFSLSSTSCINALRQPSRLSSRTLDRRALSSNSSSSASKSRSWFSSSRSSSCRQRRTRLCRKPYFRQRRKFSSLFRKAVSLG